MNIDFLEIASAEDAVEAGRVLRVGVCVGTIQLRIEGGRADQRESFLLLSEDSERIALAISAAAKIVDGLGPTRPRQPSTDQNWNVGDYVLINQQTEGIANYGGDGPAALAALAEERPYRAAVVQVLAVLDEPAIP